MDTQPLNLQPRAHPTPTELIASSKARFALGQARLRRGQDELALLSFHGSLEDGLRAHLVLHSDPAAHGDWLQLLDAMRDDQWQPLSAIEIERIGRIENLRLRLSHGDRVTLTEESLQAYQQFVARLLARYGVLVVASEVGVSSPQRERAAMPAPVAVPFWQRYRTHLAPVLVVLAVFIIGAATTIMLQQARPPQAAVILQTPAPTLPLPITTFAPVSEPSLVPPEPTAVPANVLAAGRLAYVRSDIGGGGLALRARPGTANDNPVQFYLSPDTQVEVVAGPVDADGYSWWQVRVANQEGWCAGEFLEVR